MDNLLLEHPTMSIYQQVIGTDSKDKQLVPYDTSKMQVAIRNQNKQLVLYRKRNQMELATQMGITLKTGPKMVAEPAPAPPKLNKKATKKHNNNIRIVRGKKFYKIHQCGVKAGRRRN